MTTPSEIAATYFNQHYCCSQSVFLAFATDLGLDKVTALKLSSPFGGGVGRRGEVCGAITGALMALGLARGGDNPAKKDETYRIAQEFIHRFEEKRGKLLCRDFIGYDLTTPEGLRAAEETGVYTSICFGLVQDAVEILQKMLETA